MVPIRGDVLNLKTIGFNDVLSSLRIGPGTNVEVYTAANFHGRSLKLHGDVAKMPLGWNDEISSIKVYR